MAVHNRGRGPTQCGTDRSSLIRPHPSHSRAHRDFTAQRLIRDPFAERERLGDPRVVPGFRCSFLPDMPSSLTSGSSIIVWVQTAMSTLAFTMDQRARHSQMSRNPFHAGHGFRGYYGSQLLRPVRLLAPLDGSDREALRPPGTFTSRLSTGSVALTVAGYNYNSDWSPLLAGLSPAGMAASLAALDRPCSCP